jgi:hypothetical protein
MLDSPTRPDEGSAHTSTSSTAAVTHRAIELVYPVPSSNHPVPQQRRILLVVLNGMLRSLCQCSRVCCPCKDDGSFDLPADDLPPPPTPSVSSKLLRKAKKRCAYVSAFAQYECGTIFRSLTFVLAVTLSYPGTLARLLAPHLEMTALARACRPGSFRSRYFRRTLVKMRNFCFSFRDSSWLAAAKAAVALEGEGKGNDDTYKECSNQADDEGMSDGCQGWYQGPDPKKVGARGRLIVGLSCCGGCEEGSTRR